MDSVSSRSNDVWPPYGQIVRTTKFDAAVIIYFSLGCVTDSRRRSKARVVAEAERLLAARLFGA